MYGGSVNKPANSLRVERLWLNDIEIPPVSKELLDAQRPTWRSDTGTMIEGWFGEGSKIYLYPSLTSTMTGEVDYRSWGTFGATSTMPAPAWTKYSAVPYVCWKAYLFPGANHDLNRAMKWKSRFKRWVRVFDRVVNTFWG